MKLKENEKIIKVIKSHFFTRLILSGYVFLFVVILAGIYFFLGDFSYKFIALLGLTQIFLVVFYYLYVSFELGIFVITNLRIIYVKKINIFQNEYADIELTQITGIKAKQTGIFAHYFGYGTLFLSTKIGEINLKYVGDALNEAKEITNIIKENV
ncbi:MAG: PH domain-containing protein [Candidatus Altimarinota bacterium]